MKIKRFFENEVQGPEGVTDLVNDISKERVEQIVKELGSISATYGDKLTTLKKFEEELSKYKSKSKESNDQIDDAVVTLQQINKSVEQDILNDLDSIVSKLNDYIDNGRNYIYDK